jgi:hypothetical protein
MTPAPAGLILIGRSGGRSGQIGMGSVENELRSSGCERVWKKLDRPDDLVDLDVNLGKML